MQAMKFSRAALVLAAVGATAGAAAQAGDLRVSTGYDRSTGTYGSSQTTTITSIPFVVAYDQGPWTLKLALPWVRIEGSGNVVPGVGQVSRGAIAPSSASGMGDAVGSVVYNLYNDPSRQLGVDLTGKVKFATADESQGLGTGQNDYTVLVDVYRKYRSTTVFATVGHAWLGRSPALPLRNVFNTSLGASYQLTQADSIGASFDWRQKVLATASDQREVMGFISHKFDRHWKGQLYMLKGFSDGSPDWGGGATIGYAF